MIGKTILHYKITEKLGEGGMGVVYKAEDTKLKRLVAIKFLPRQIATSDEERERFKIEAQAAAALNHPNIATIYAIEEVNGELFIVMEYIEGKELRELIQSDIPDAKSAIAYATQIAEGLQAAHNKGIVHRDIKSSNIMITEGGNVKIMDFGLAKIRGGVQLTRDHSTLGTTAYMSPEQARGEIVDQRTDIWSFGVVLHELLTGQLPFKGDYEQAVVYAIMNEEPEYVATLPELLKAILKKALAKDPAQRYQHMSQVLADLNKWETRREPDPQPIAGVSRRPRSLKYLLAAVGLFGLILAIWFLRPTNSLEQKIDSLAVLPLANLSGDPTQDYFSDGMTEALITDLSKISALKVISRTSVMQYKNAKKPLPEIASELGVKAIIAGSVMRDGNRVRITAQLIDAQKDRHLWAQSYERDMADIFALQRDIARAIAAQVRATLTPGEQKQLRDVRQIDPAAYEAYLKGVYHDVKYNPSDFAKSLDYFRQSVEKEPEFVLGYIGIVRAATGMMDLGGMPFSKLYPIAKTALDKALQLGKSQAEVYGILGRFRHIAEWDWAGAEEAFRKSLALNPNLSNTYFDYASFLISINRGEEALIMIKKARSLDPLNAGINNDVGWIYYYVRRYDDAIREYKNNIEMYPDFVMSHRELAWVYAKKSMFPEAIQSIKRAVDLERSSYNLAQLAIVYALAGQKDKTLQILEEIQSGPNMEHLADYEFAMIYSALGDVDEAYRWLEKSYQEHSGWPFLIIIDPLADPLRSDPRYKPFLKRLGLEA